jgi:hypothetical protein
MLIFAYCTLYLYNELSYNGHTNIHPSIHLSMHTCARNSYMIQIASQARTHARTNIMHMQEIQKHYTNIHILT